MSVPPALIVIPALNEAAHIRNVIEDLQDGSHDCPIIVADGGSTDQTRGIVMALATQDSRIRLVSNPARTQAHAVNTAAQHAARAGIPVLIRADAHARYPAGFVTQLLRTMTATQANSVVVPLLCAPERTGAGWLRASALLQSGWLGHGGAAHRRACAAGPVEHGHHAAFRVTTFLALGGYDTSFAANEDVDYDIRLQASGGSIHMEPACPVTYSPRPSPVRLFRQMHRNGQARVRNGRKHRRALSLRQLLPITAAGTVILSLLLAPIDSRLILPALAYGSLVLALALSMARGRPLLSAQVFCLAVAQHMGFGIGAFTAIWGRKTSAPSPHLSLIAAQGARK